MITHCGQPPDRGRIIVGEQFPNEGYAILKCGNTEVQISYTVLHQLIIERSPFETRDMEELQNAFHSITCEASLGRIGE